MIGHRRVLPYATYLITKKCTDDLFLLKPTRQVKQILRYELSRRARRYGMRVHAFCFMRNHFHLVVSDISGNLPAFMRDFLTNTSKAIQISLGIDRPIWNRKRYSHVHLLDLDAAERKIAYTLLNPTRAGLTLPRNFPGLTSATWIVGQTVRTRRPTVFYCQRYTPEYEELTLVSVVPDYDSSGKGDVSASKARIAAEVQAGVAGVLEEMEEENRQFAGALAVFTAPLHRRGNRRVTTFRPLFATTNKLRMAAAVAAKAEFEDWHAAAKERYIQGDREVEFPPGTYGYRVQLDVKVATAKHRFLI